MGRGGQWFSGGGHLKKMYDKGGAIQKNERSREGGAIQKTKERWGIFLYYLTKDGLH